MPYTNVWAVTNNPAGTDASANADDDVRKVRLDVQERMETLIGTGKWSTDPVVVWQTEDHIFIPWNEFTVQSGVATWTAAAGSNYGATTASVATYTLYSPVLLPRGVTVKKIAITGQTHASGTLTLTLESVDVTGAPTQTTHATATITAGLSQREADSGDISITLDSTASNYIYYYLKLVLVMGGASATWFQGAHITYSRSSLAQSI